MPEKFGNGDRNLNVTNTKMNTITTLLAIHETPYAHYHYTIFVMLRKAIALRFISSASNAQINSIKQPTLCLHYDTICLKTPPGFQYVNYCQHIYLCLI